MLYVDTSTKEARTATEVVSGRVDEKVRQRADAYIRAAGSTPAEVIKVVWENIARTGEVPTGEPAKELRGTWERFMEFRESLSDAEPWLVNLTKEQMRDMIASRYA